MVLDANIVVIGLKARKDRWQRCRKIFEDNGIEKVYHYGTVQNYDDPYMGYMTDFLKMLRMFRGEHLMFFEDDFELVSGWEGVLRSAVEELPKEWDMLYLGSNLTRPVKQVGRNLVKMGGGWLMHATLLHPNFIEYVLKYYNPRNVKIIDEWYRGKAEYRNFYMTMPMVSFQRRDYSDFVGQYVYYDIFQNKYYTTAYDAYENFKHSTQLRPVAEQRSGVDAA